MSNLKALLTFHVQFEPSFTATLLHGNDWLTGDPSGGIARTNLIGMVKPDDGDTPFIMEATGIQFGTSLLQQIVSTNTTSDAAIPYGDFYSGNNEI